jgi:hypothetical protein
MQAESDRPAFLKQRIMGGSGHLSNEQSAEAAAEIGPGQTLVLLHLSRECNTPERAERVHRSVGRPTLISSQQRATGWIRCNPGAGDARRGVVTMPRTLFGACAGGPGGAGG